MSRGRVQLALVVAMLTGSLVTAAVGISEIVEMIAPLLMLGVLFLLILFVEPPKPPERDPFREAADGDE